MVTFTLHIKMLERRQTHLISLNSHLCVYKLQYSSEHIIYILNISKTAAAVSVRCCTQYTHQAYTYTPNRIRAEFYCSWGKWFRIRRYEYDVQCIPECTVHTTMQWMNFILLNYCNRTHRNIYSYVYRTTHLHLYLLSRIRAASPRINFISIRNAEID